MLNSKILRQLIKDIYNLDDDFIVPISSNWFIPEINLDEKPGTYIGYRIISKRNCYAETLNNKHKKDYIKTGFRLCFVGPESEALKEQVHFWKDNQNVNKLFSFHKLVLNYTDMTSFTYPVRNEKGYQEMAWIIDMSCNSDYFQDLKQINSDSKKNSVFRKLITNGGKK